MLGLNFYRQQKRRQKIEEGLVDAFTFLANALKAGLALPQALELASRDLTSPLRDEFQIVVAKIQRGLSLKEALVASAGSLKITDYSLMVHSVLLLRDMGGNMVTHLEKLSQVLRERQTITQKISLLTSQGLFQGMILGCLPLFFGCALSLLAPQWMEPLWTTAEGWGIFFLILLLDLGGFFWMRRWARVEV